MVVSGFIDMMALLLSLAVSVALPNFQQKGLQMTLTQFNRSKVVAVAPEASQQELQHLLRLLIAEVSSEMFIVQDETDNPAVAVGPNRCHALLVLANEIEGLQKHNNNLLEYISKLTAQIRMLKGWEDPAEKPRKNKPLVTRKETGTDQKK